MSFALWRRKAFDGGITRGEHDGMDAVTEPAAAALREAIAAMSGTVERLIELSRARYQNPYAAVRWPQTRRRTGSTAR